MIERPILLDDEDQMIELEDPFIGRRGLRRRLGRSRRCQREHRDAEERDEEDPSGTEDRGTPHVAKPSPSRACVLAAA
jgi:hypothetical protein